LVILIVVVLLLTLFPVLNVWAKENMWDDPSGKAAPSIVVNTIATPAKSVDELASTLENTRPGITEVFCYGKRYVVSGGWSLVLCPSTPPEHH
jgi:hypothetical protein